MPIAYRDVPMLPKLALSLKRGDSVSASEHNIDKIVITGLAAMLPACAWT